MNKRHLILGSILAGSILSLGVANIASACSGHDGHHRGHGMMHSMKGLDLSEEQRSSIKTIMESQRKQMQASREQMRDIRKSLHAQATAAQYDASKVRTLADAKAKIMADMTVQRIESMHRIHQQLTPEQAAKMESMKSKHQHRHEGMEDK